MLRNKFFCSSPSLIQNSIQQRVPLLFSTFRFASSNQQIQPLRTVLNQFKRAGAHPDLISMIDPNKAQQNGKMLMELEQALQDRQDETWRKQQVQKLMHLDDDEAERQGILKLKFWIKRNNNNTKKNAKASQEKDNDGITIDLRENSPIDAMKSSQELRLVECDLTPYRQDHIVQEQLEKLFSEAGIFTPFEVKSPGGADDDNVRQQPQDLRSRLDQALYYRQESMNNKNTSALLSRAKFAVNVLRGRGVVVCIRDSNGSSYLITMPEKPTSNLNTPSSSTEFSPEYDQEQLAFIRDRGFQPFDLRSIATESAAETIVDKLEQLAQWYLTVQGTTLRPGVCYLIENNDKVKQPSITSDGCISLPMLTPHLWQEFLFSLLQPEWTSLVKSQETWRSHQPSLLRLRKSHQARIADMLYVKQIDVKAGVGSMNDKWVNEFCDNFLKEEVAIRKTTEKYASELRNIKMKQRGVIEVVNGNLEVNKNTNNCQKVCADGTIVIPSTMSPINVLKFLKQEKRMALAAKNLEAFALAESHLEHIGHMTRLKIGIDRQWRKSSDKDIALKLKQITATLRFSQEVLLKFSRRGGGGGHVNHLSRPSASITLMICDEDRYSTAASMMSAAQMSRSGVVPIHWNIKASDLSKTLLTM